MAINSDLNNSKSPTIARQASINLHLFLFTYIEPLKRALMNVWLWPCEMPMPCLLSFLPSDSDSISQRNWISQFCVPLRRTVHSTPNHPFKSRFVVSHSTWFSRLFTSYRVHLYSISRFPAGFSIDFSRKRSFNFWKAYG